MNFSARTLHFVFALVSALILSPLYAQAQSATPTPRIALVIGNAAYADQALATTANDAGLIAQTLQAAGFDVVGARDLDGQSLRTAFRDFLDKAAAAGPDMQAFVYLSGRALQYNGDNYFVPIDARITHDAEAPLEAVRLSDFTHALAQTPGRVRIVVIDGARANPYAAEGSPLAPGLALVDPEPGELIAFNAAPGTLAGDEQGPYGVYGKTLAGAMRQGGVDIAEVFDQTRVLVNQQTQGALIPWSASKLDGPYYVFERAADTPPPPVAAAAQEASRPISALSPQDAYAAALARDTMSAYEAFLAAHPHSDQARRVRAILAARREAAFWRRSVNANTPRAYWTYLQVYPKGPHVADARRRLAILSAQFEPPPDFRPAAYEDLPPPPPDERFYEERPVYAFDDFGPPPPPPPTYYVYEDEDEWRDLPPPPPPQAVGALPALAIAIPLAVGAVAYHDRWHREGLAPRGYRPPPPPPPAPPPLPANIKPIAPPPPQPVLAVPQRSGMAVVKPLPPIGPAPIRAKPPAAPVAPGAPPPVAQPGAATTAPTPVPGAPPAAGKSGAAFAVTRTLAGWRRQAHTLAGSAEPGRSSWEPPRGDGRARCSSLGRRARRGAFAFTFTLAGRRRQAAALTLTGSAEPGRSSRQPPRGDGRARCSSFGRRARRGAFAFTRALAGRRRQAAARTIAGCEPVCSSWEAVCDAGSGRPLTAGRSAFGGHAPSPSRQTAAHSPGSNCAGGPCCSRRQPGRPAYVPACRGDQAGAYAPARIASAGRAGGADAASCRQTGASSFKVAGAAEAPCPGNETARRGADRAQAATGSTRPCGASICARGSRAGAPPVTRRPCSVCTRRRLSLSRPGRNWLHSSLRRLHVRPRFTRRRLLPSCTRRRLSLSRPRHRWCVRRLRRLRPRCKRRLPRLFMRRRSLPRPRALHAASPACRPARNRRER